jgi:hypothetical protein
MKEQQDKTPTQQRTEDTLTTRPGERIIADLLERIKNRKLAESGELSWDDHSQSYTEWSRQR